MSVFYSDNNLSNSDNSTITSDDSIESEPNSESNSEPNSEPTRNSKRRPNISFSEIETKTDNVIRNEKRLLKKKSSSESDGDLSDFSEFRRRYKDTSYKKKICRCVSCGRQVEDVLFLTCKHFLCLVCGSEQLNRKYEKYIKNCKIQENTENNRKYDIKECFNNYKDKKKEKTTHISNERYKKEVLASVSCCLCNIESDLSVDAIEMLTRVGLISSDVLNVHKLFFNKNTNGINNDKNILSYTNTRNDSYDLNNTVDNDFLLNEDLKKLKKSKQKYDYLNEQTDNLNEYSYICNICSHNEAILYCKDCVEYLCQACFDNIHELDMFEKLNLKCKNVHDYYPIDKTRLNLKKIVKGPKKCYNINEEEYNRNMEELEDDECFDETPFKGYDEDDPRHNHKIQDKDSDFDKYDEEHFNKRINKFIEQKNKNKNNEIISEKINDLVKEMKDGSDYESVNSSCRGSLGSTISRPEKRKGTNINHIKKKSNFKRKKKGSEEEDICSFHSGNSELISSDDDDYLNGKKKKEICISNVRDILNEDKNAVIEKSNDPSVYNADFTVIQNIRCPEHFGYPIQYYCHTCCNKCFCSECAINGTHNMECHIENINTAFITILNKYLIKWNEIISDLITDLHRNFYDSLKDTQKEWSSLLSECFCELNTGINYVVNNLTKKEIEIINNLNVYLQNFKKENMEYEQLLKDKQNKIDEIINIIRSNKYQTDPVNLIKFYRNNLNDITKVILMNQDISGIENLANVRESKIFYMDFYTSQLMNYLKHLQSITDVNHPI